ncbi:insulinase family protein [Konateibacter massiliensis]|uniref:insulinase family protein n=1 Tax=Konateibacter massiliensis TaxID=2002841 RepID=UPI000C15CB26|nr:insulinase family protein [Konateibacter massiliensis]
MKINDIKEYQVLEERKIDDLNSKGYLLRHKKSGARIALLENDDENKVFYVGFRTPPNDDTGLPHILEHSVLCGSEKFPAKDPFVELVKGSLNTFLNAMTYPDKTIYPIASCNEKDFQNLMHVYMDAVLHPNIYKKEEIFKQEGWHYDLESADAKLKYNGVVYNEMKGAFSSPEGVLGRLVLNSLFPDTAYSKESGGEPSKIPDLTYNEFIQFHKTYYHPANSYIYIYGDMNMAEKLLWLDKEYLSKYDEISVDSEIKFQKPFEKAVEVTEKYSITDGEPMADNTFLSYNMAVGTSLDVELYLAFQILEYALLSAPGAPLKKALLDAKIGKDIMGSYDNGTLQPIFSVVAKNSNTESKDKFISIIQDTLSNIVKNGLDEKAIKAGINYNEFRYREADFGNYPKGLMYGLQILDSWLYDDKKPFIHIQALDTFEFLKKQIGTGYYENLIKDYLVDNKHVSVVIVEPERGLTAKNDKLLAEKLKAYKESLSKEEIERLVEETKALEQYQETPSSKEEMEAIPMLKREDMKKEASKFYNEVRNIDGVEVLHHNLFTNGIGYLELLFDAKKVSNELIPYMGILKSVLGYIDTENYSYGDLFNEININTGGISNVVNLFPNLNNRGEFQVKFQIRSKVLYENLNYSFKMVKEILLNSKFEDEKRLYEIVAQLKSRLQMTLNSSGHSMAVMRGCSYFSPVSYYSDLMGGIEFYRVLEKLEGDFENQKAGLIDKLKELMHIIFRPENLMVSYTSNDTGFAYLEKEIKEFKDSLYQDDCKEGAFVPQLEKKNEGFKTSSKVQYVARTGNFLNKNLKYTGVLKMLKVILSYDYLWTNVRVKGGAYGCMSNFAITGDSYLVSYRDPNLKKTNEIYNGTAAYLRSFQADEREMTKFIIGTVSDLDSPLTPMAKGVRSLSAYLTNLTIEQVQKERNEILNATVKDIQALGDIVDAVLAENAICVIGNEDKLEKEKDLFNKLENLYSN